MNTFDDFDSLGSACEDALIIELLDLIEKGYGDRGIWAPIFDDSIFVICVLRYGSRTLDLTRVFDRLGAFSPNVASQINRFHSILNEDFPEADLLRERELAKAAALEKEADALAEKRRALSLARCIRRDERRRWASKEVRASTLAAFLAIDTALGL